MPEFPKIHNFLIGRKTYAFLFTPFPGDASKFSLEKIEKFIVSVSYGIPSREIFVSQNIRQELNSIFSNENLEAIEQGPIRYRLQSGPNFRKLKKTSHGDELVDKL